jgi:hypothetical protein
LNQRELLACSVLAAGKRAGGWCFYFRRLVSGACSDLETWGNDSLGQEKRQCCLPARDLVEGPRHFTSLAYGYGSASSSQAGGGSSSAPIRPRKTFSFSHRRILRRQKLLEEQENARLGPGRQREVELEGSGRGGQGPEILYEGRRQERGETSGEAG